MERCESVRTRGPGGVMCLYKGFWRQHLHVLWIIGEDDGSGVALGIRMDKVSCVATAAKSSGADVTGRLSDASASSAAAWLASLTSLHWTRPLGAKPSVNDWVETMRRITPAVSRKEMRRLWVRTPPSS